MNKMQYFKTKSLNGKGLFKNLFLLLSFTLILQSIAIATEIVPVNCTELNKNLCEEEVVSHVTIYNNSDCFIKVYCWDFGTSYFMKNMAPKSSYSLVPSDPYGYIYYLDSNNNLIRTDYLTGFNIYTFYVNSFASCNPCQNQNSFASILGNTSVCQGATTTLTAQGGGAYNWNTGATSQSISVGAGTYSVTVTNSSGCTSTATRTINVDSPPIITIAGSSTVCNGGMTVLAAQGGSTYQWNTGATEAYILVSSGTYSVVGTSVNGCTAVATKTISNSGTVIATIDGNSTVCQGGTTTLTAQGGGSYQWSTGSNAQSITVGAGTYSVIVTNASGCTGVATRTVTNSGSVIAAIDGNSAVCNGSLAILTAQGGSSYQWSTGSNAQSITVGAGTYSVIVTNASGCTGVATRTVTNSGSVIAAIAGNSTVCNGSTIVLTAQGGSSYQWSTGSNAQSITVGAGTYTVTVTSASGCTGVATKTVTNSSTVIAAIDGNGAVCNGSLAILTAQGGSSYQWSTGSNAQSITVGAGTYSVIVTNASGCTGVASRTVTNSGTVIAAIDGNSTVCNGSLAILTAQGGSSYQWSTGSNAQSITVVAGTYTVTVTSASGCTGVATKTVTNSSTVIAAIAGNGTVCNGSLAILTAQGGSSYQWSTGSNAQSITVVAGTYSVIVTNASGCTGVVTRTVTNSGTVIAAIDGNSTVCNGSLAILTAQGGSSYQWSTGSNAQSITVGAGTYTVTVTNASGCTGVATRTVTNSGSVIAAIAGNSTVCNGSTIVLTAQGGSSYQWSTGSNAQSITVGAGTYTVTVTSASGCTGVSTRIVTNSGSITATIAGNNTVCNGGMTVLTAQGGSSYQWSTGSNTQSVTVGAGTYSVTVTSASGCTGVSTRTVTNSGSITATIAGNNTVCNGGTTVLTAQGGSSYQWSTGSNAQSITVGAGTYTVTVTSASGCTGVATKTVTNSSTVIAAIDGNGTVCNGSLAILTVQGGSSYQWSTGSNAQSITVVAGTYSVIVTNASGCTGVVTRTVTNSGTVIAAIDGNSTVCNGSLAILTAQGGSSYQWSTGSNAQSITVGAGTYSVIVTNASGCTGVATRTVTNSGSVIAAIAGNSTVCNGSTIVLTAQGGSSYQWSTGSNAQSITVGAGTYSVIVTNASGCTGVATRTVKNSGSVIAAIDGNNTVCNGSTTVLTAQGGSTYRWNTGVISQSITVGAGTYSVIVTNASGCTGVSTRTVTNSGSVNATIAGNSTVCNGSTTVLTAQGGITYRWSTGITSQSITVGAGTYTVTVTSASGCTGVATKTVTNSGSITATIAGNSTVCNGSTTVLTAQGGITYRWSTGITSQSITVGAGTYTVTVTSASGCTGVSTRTVTNSGSIIATIDGNSTVCQGVTTILTAQGGSSYQWSTGSNAQSITVGAGTYSVTVTSASGCTGVSTRTVTNSGSITPTIAGNSTVCNGGTTVLTAQGGITYRWSTGVTSQSITVGAGTYTVTVTSASGCTGVSTRTVTNGFIAVKINCNAIICTGTSTVLTAEGGVSYKWSTGAIGQSVTVVAGTYSVTATGSNGCTGSTTATITYDPNLCQKGSIGDYIFKDTNCNGIQDGGDTPIAGVFVQLKDANNNVIQATISGTNGKYVFNNLLAATYKVCFNIPNGCEPTLKKAIGSNSINDSNINADGTTDLIILNPGQIITNVDAGFKSKDNAYLGDRVFEDTNGNGIQDNNEIGIPNITVFLTGTGINGTAVNRTTTTLSTGKYLFSNLPAGTYKVTFSIPSTYKVTPKNRGNDDAIDSDVDPVSFTTENYSLAVGEGNLTVDAGLFRTACLGDFVFIDKNRNGLQDNSELGQPNVILKLFGTTNTGETVVFSTISDANGYYKFNNLAPGTYYIQAILPIGYLFTNPNQGTDDAKDSDIDPSNSKTDNVSLLSNQSYLILDIGIFNKFENPCLNDVTPPTFVNVPLNITVECDAIPTTPPTVTDNCGFNGNLTKNDEVVQGNCPNNFTIKRTWKATDNNANTTIITQTIVVRDTKAPVIYGVPTDITIVCGTPIPLPPSTSPTGVRATDNCNKDVTITFSELYYSGVCVTPQNSNGIGQILCQWKAVDACGNYSIKTWKITIIPNSGTTAKQATNNTFKPIDMVSQKGEYIKEAVEVEKEIVAYPNPSSGEFTLNFGTQKVTQLTLLNGEGKEIYNTPIGAEQQLFEVDMNNYSTGLYILLMKTTTRVITERIMLVK